MEEWRRWYKMAMNEIRRYAASVEFSLLKTETIFRTFYYWMWFIEEKEVRDYFRDFPLDNF